MMTTDIPGRVRNTRLPQTKPLLPVFEAIVNSIHAIQELGTTGSKKGRITILVERDTSQLILDPDDDEVYPIKSFHITDNGVGFNEKNFESFNTADTTHKLSQGGKGIGRFLWLKAFNNVEVDSAYFNGEKRFNRKFNFSLCDDGILAHTNNETIKRSLMTKVSLKNIKEAYVNEYLPKKTEKIAQRIIEHCLIYFVEGTCPTIILKDGSRTINLNDRFDRDLKQSVESQEFDINGQAFTIRFLKLYSSQEHEHRIYYCANQREVLSYPLKRLVNDIPTRLSDDEGNFVCLVYLSGILLDENVNPERTNFLFLQDEDSLFESLVTKTQLENEVASYVENYLDKHLLVIRTERLGKIQSFIQTTAPQYRALLKDEFRSDLEKLSTTGSQDKLENELHKINYKVNIEIRKQTNAILATNLDAIELPVVEKQLSELINKVNDFGKAALADYIIHRRAILDLLDKRLSLRNNDKYELEKTIHQTIFPMNSTSDEIDYEKHNLWIIDERLSYHLYLASDKKLSKIEAIQSDSDSRPDVLIFNNPFALSDTPNDSINAVVIIEFKRPMRDHFTDEDNPIDQVTNYIQSLLENKQKTNAGRPITIRERTPFYCYILCDLTSDSRKMFLGRGYKLTPDGDGFFNFNDNFNAYIEIISYNKLLFDARKRNRVLFEKLGIV